MKIKNYKSKQNNQAKSNDYNQNTTSHFYIYQVMTKPCKNYKHSNPVQNKFIHNK